MTTVYAKSVTIQNASVNNLSMIIENLTANGSTIGEQANITIHGDGESILNDTDNYGSIDVNFPGSIKLENDSHNYGTIIGNTVFTDTSYNASNGTVSGNASFIGVNAYNQPGGEISGQQSYDPPVYGHFTFLRWAAATWEARHLISYRDPNNENVGRQQWYMYPQPCPCLGTDGCLNDIESYSQFAPFTPPFIFVSENQPGWSENIEPCPSSE